MLDLNGLKDNEAEAINIIKLQLRRSVEGSVILFDNYKNSMIVNKQLAESNGVDQKDLWQTPDEIFYKLDAEFDFTLDPCCEIETALCQKFYTPKEDGLLQDWKGERAFVNPPYSRGNIDKWARKCYAQSIHENTIVVALLPVSTSADWWHNWIIGKAELRFVKRRIRFKGGKFTAPFSSVIAVFGRQGIKSFSIPKKISKPLKQSQAFAA